MVRPTPALGVRLQLTTKQVNGGYYKGTGTKSIGAHTGHGNYVIDYRKVRTFVMPNTSRCKLTPFVTAEMRPRSRMEDGMKTEPPRVDGMRILRTWKENFPDKYRHAVEDQDAAAQEAAAAEEAAKVAQEEAAMRQQAVRMAKRATSPATRKERRAYSSEASSGSLANRSVGDTSDGSPSEQEVRARWEAKRQRTYEKILQKHEDRGEPLERREETQEELDEKWKVARAAKLALPAKREQTGYYARRKEEKVQKKLAKRSEEGT